MKCLVTGATGFLGTNLTHELVAAGWDVRASGFSGSSKYIDSLPVEFVRADITDASRVDALVEGCEIVFHVAGDTSFWKKRFELQRRINVLGTTNIANACLRHGVQRLVHTSTLDVLGHDPSKALITEESGQFNFDQMGYNYGETKYEADTILRRYEAEHGLDVVFAYPGFLCGPYDFTLQLGSVFFELRDQSLPGSPCGGSSFCHVTDVARAHIAAAEKGCRGEAYTLGGHNMTTHDWFGLMAAAIDAMPPRRVIPEWALVAYGYGAEWWSYLTKKAPGMNPGQARYMSKFQYMDCSKAIAELDYVIPPVEEIIGDAVDWYRANGYEREGLSAWRVASTGWPCDRGPR